MSLLTNLLHYYNCNENTGTSLGSTLGSSNKTGTLSGTATWVAPGVVGASALSIAGFVNPNYGMVQCAAPSGIQGATNVTVTFWVKINHTGDYQYGTLAGALFQGSFISRFEVVGGDTAKPRDINLSVCNGAASNVTVTNALPSTGVWHHVAVVYDGAGATDSDKVKLYVNGAVVTIPAWGAAVPSSLPNNTTYGWYFGRRSDTSGPGKHDMDEIGIWNRSLSAAEVLSVYKGGLAGQNFPPADLTQNSRNLSLNSHQ